MIDRINEAPSIDICFCRECKFSEVMEFYGCEVIARYCKAFNKPMLRSDDDFCSYGERKEQ